MGKLNIDSHKLMYHPERVADWMRSKGVSPIQAEIGLTSRCNHQCTFCTIGWVNVGGKKYDINTNVMLNTLEDMAKFGVRAIYFAGEGEPTLHKDIDKILAKTNEIGIKTSLSTNGSLLDYNLASKILPYLSWVRFSLDAGTSETHSKIHNSNDFNKVIDNIKNCVQIKYHENLDLNIGVQSLLLPENISELKNLGVLLRGAGVDNFQLKPFMSHPFSSRKIDGNDYIPEGFGNELEQLSTDDFTVIYRKNSIEKTQREKKCVECYGTDFTALIDSKGDVVPCNIYYTNKEFVFGSLYNKKFSEIWKSDRRKQITDKINSQKNKVCKNYVCRFDATNTYLERIKNPTSIDDFI